MDVIQLIKREHEKTSSLFEKLADTSDNATKTRERLFDQLKTGVEAHTRVMHDIVYPLLRENDETRDLVPQDREYEEPMHLLEELDQTPKDDESFLKRLKGVRKTVEQQLRAEEKQIVPALKKVVDEDEAQDLAKRIAAELKEPQEGSARGEEGGPFGQYSGSAGAEAMSVSMHRAAEQTAEASDGLRQAGETMARVNQRAVGDLKALMGASSLGTRALQEAQQTYIEWARRTAEMNIRASQDLWRCTNPREMAEAQGGLVQRNLNAWLEGSAQMLRLARRFSDEALRPIERRVGQARRAGRDEQGTQARREAE